LEKITINTLSHKSEILIGVNWTSFINYLHGRNAAIVTDDNILRLYGKHFDKVPFLSITPGEKNKKLELINELAAKLLDLGVDRSGFLVGIGGGVVCDIAGFLASVYMRGIQFGFVSTSLLSQVDASVGGKNGVNVGTVKNILGTFNQPEFVICDPLMLKTLPDDEYLSGLAELIKHGLISDSELFNTIEQNIESILKRDPSLLIKLITKSVEIKASVVGEDEKETGRRKILNFGHTFGHAIEAQSGLKHGFAVASGMVIAADISVKLGMLQPEDRSRIFNLLNSFGLLKDYNISVEKMKEFIIHDKKKKGNEVDFILIEKTGKSSIKKIDINQLISCYKSTFKNL
jgi:3-dehydroquinate synthase